MKVAILDVDGTLYPKNFGALFLEKLVSSHLFNNDFAEKIREAEGKYKQNRLSRDELLSIWPKYYSLGLKGIKKHRMEEIAAELWEEEKKNVFSFVPKLIEILSEKKYTKIVISASPLEVIRLLCNELRIDNYWAATFQIKNEVYTGKPILLPIKSEDKRKVLLDFGNRNNIDWNNSFAIGDSVSDQATLEMVGKPVVFEPHASFLPLAEKHAWRIANRDNVLKIVEDYL